MGEDDFVVVYYDDVGDLIAVCREMKQRVGINIETFGKPGDHRGMRQAAAVFPAGYGGMIDKQLFSELLL